MINQQLIKALHEIAELKEVLGDIRFRVVAYQKAAQSLSYVSQDLAEIYKQKGLKGLQEIEGIGEAIAKHIEEYIKKGKVREWEKLRARVAPAVLKLMEIPGIGPKTALKLAKSLDVVSIEGLKKSLQKISPKTQAKLAKIGLKQKSIENVLRGIDIIEKHEGRMLLVEAFPIVEQVKNYMEKASNLTRFDAVGSFRRWRETVGDIDFIGSSKTPQKVIDYFVKGPYVEKIIAKGDTKATIIHQSGQQIDFEILPAQKYGSLLQHFTGSKEHNVALRTWAVEHGFSVSEHGIKRLRRKSEIRNPKSEKLITCPNEQCVYNTMGMDWIPPELREDRGEVGAALKHQLPKLVNLDDVNGDLQVHSNWSDGYETIENMARQAQKLGHQYVAFTDHSVGLGVARGLDKKRLDQRQKEIEKVQKKLKIKILAGIEVNIKANGQLDLPDKVLEELDFVLAAVHSSFNQDKATMTHRLIGAIEHPMVQAIAHPTGRIIEKRPSYQVDWPEVFKAAAKHKKALEIDGFPDRLDLPDFLVKQAKDYGVKFTIGTDSHKLEHLEFMPYGVAVARRGWLTKQDIINTMEIRDLIKWLKR